ncbi:putative phosphatase [Nautilia profundicola AmH]|uniref:Phosphatase n=1 Tax=Nautilia profundicola (strain ATCC BAA-1463 / DSM 18972 / AmH) TaxID=598659 RepID=B9L9A3_NAUPA|nr:phosphatase [Nautilia profundicola]ACM93018.1 putative phosphatase [Nautilia profundicola AmH]
MIAIDLGSNTIRAIKYDCATNTKIDEFERIVKTADKLVKTDGITDEAIERIINAINDMKQRFNISENEKIKAIATEALRAAKNKDYVIKKIKEATGIEFEIITPEDEANYTAIAVEKCLEKCGYDNYNHFLLVDIGGGSTEVTVKNKDSILSESFRLGIVTITQRHKTPEAIKIAIKKKMKDVKSFFDFAFNTLRKPKIFVASSGTPTTIAALKLGMNYSNYDGSRVNGTKVTLEDLDYWAEKLMKMEMKKREELVGVGRGDLIISGIYIFKEIFKLAKYKECIVCDDGLREGVAIEECKNI